MQDTSYYMHGLLQFLDEVAANNNRPWFAANKERYTEYRALWMADIERFIAAMAVIDARLGVWEARKAAYRFYRDTRFSLNKAPYKTNFSAALSPTGNRDRGAGYYLQIGEGLYSHQGLYGGIWCPPVEELRKLRKAIVDNIEEFEALLAEPTLRRLYPEWCGEALKTVPKGYDRNHPQAHLLRLKEYGRYHCLGREFFLDPQWPIKAAELMAPLAPLIEFINYSLYEEE